MKKKSAFILVMIIMTIASTADAKKKNVIMAQGGVPVPNLGMTIDASYDPRLDNFAPGYKMVNVAIVNESLNIIYMDPQSDKWIVVLADDSKEHTAVHDLRQKDPKAWAQTPERVRDFIGYPLALPIGARQVIDLFLPKSLDLTKFIKLKYYIASLNTLIDIEVRQ